MKIVFHGANALTFRDGLESLLDQAHEVAEVPDDLATETARATYAAADVIVGVQLTAAMPVSHSLRLYQVPAAGYDRIDPAALPAGAALCNCFGHENAIAEYVMAALLARHVPLADADRRLRMGDWKYWAGGPTGLRTDLGETGIGILGYGHIGKTLALRAKAFGMKVTVANRSPVLVSDIVDKAYALKDLPAFMGSADAIVNTLPLTDETRGLIGEADLAAMRPDAVILNVGRGAVIDEAALYNALKAGRIGGAIIDTWFVYPNANKPGPLPANLPFHELNNLVMTPHMSGWTYGTISRRRETIADNINKLASGIDLGNRIL
ncbi:2-hydroxyacid dehydrogenase [Chelativorans salis]|uniref:2-hydroxyacid dehydrogenase n=1 Tax=Chelativorans salis TaxID=2978478 RepID=A0ABT2LTR9_9HYPH|nr:2-hydroxyacid dehydrogenase [Chelativorans sp. EGI FJ00035]MCT7377935.1 2-hydroxyacid dehydrogenase [Chelativorans sp. EGI FJ00035]